MHSIDYFCTLAKLQNKELAELLGVKPPRINAWKKGERKIPQHHKEEMCDIFNVPLEGSDIFGIQELSELDRVKIELIIAKNKLQFYDPTDEQMAVIVKRDLEFNIKLLEAQVEIHELLFELKQALKNHTLTKLLFSEDNFQNELDKVRALISELKEDNK